MTKLLYSFLFISAAIAQNTAVFPGTVVTPAQLGVAQNLAATIITTGMLATDTTVNVTSSGPFRAGSFVTVDSEILAVCAIPDATHLTLGRSACPNIDGRGVDTANGGGAAATHVANAVLQARIVAWNVNQAAAETIAVEGKLHGQLISVLDFGAKCDGTTDDTAAFSAAMTALSAGGELHVPAATCVGNVVLGPQVSLIGAGSQVSIIKSATGTVPVISAPNPNRSAVRNLEIYGFGSGSGDVGISISGNTAYMEVSGNVIENTGEEGIIVGWANQISGNLLDNTALNHVHDTSGQHCAMSVPVWDSFIYGNEVTTSVNVFGFNSNIVRGAACVSGASNFIFDNVFELSDFGIFVAGTGSYNKFTANRADFDFGPGYVDGGYGNVWTGNNVFCNSLGNPGTYNAWEIHSNASIFTGNYVGIRQSFGSANCTTNYAFNLAPQAANLGGATQYGNMVFDNGMLSVSSTPGTAGNILGSYQFPTSGMAASVVIGFDSTNQGAATLHIWGQTDTPSLSATGGNTFVGPITAPTVNATTVNATTAAVTTVNSTTTNAATVNASGSVITPTVTTTTVTSTTTNATTLNATTGNIPTLVAGHLSGSSAAPTITAGSGAGTGATVSLVGTDIGGTLTITAGTSAATYSSAGIITWGTSYQGTGAICAASPFNSSSTLIHAFFAPIGSSGEKLVVVDTPLVAGISYQWAYVCTQSQ